MRKGNFRLPRQYVGLSRKFKFLAQFMFGTEIDVKYLINSYLRIHRRQKVILRPAENVMSSLVSFALCYVLFYMFTSPAVCRYFVVFIVKINFLNKADGKVTLFVLF